MPDALVRGALTLLLARPEDADAIRAIWNHEVLETDHTTDTEPRDLRAQRAWLAAHGDDHPVVVAVSDGTVLGYGALSPYRPKPAFRRTVEDSVYVKRGARGGGIGGAILAHLLELARERGHHSVLARITAPNAASLALHERHAFARIGLEREVAFKRGRWLDVVVLQKILDR
ncbi:MAG: N-acetyltransferase [Candidatus Rokubacteria bacterium]|nr:N-acetyltransferase [Candidatus Rokubacteria bacterium]